MKNRWTPRYHVYQGGKRTTVNLTMALAQLLAVKLGHTPETPAADRAIRHWLQQQLDRYNDPGMDYVSRWCQTPIVYAVLDPEIAERHGQWLLSLPTPKTPSVVASLDN